MNKIYLSLMLIFAAHFASAVELIADDRRVQISDAGGTYQYTPNTPFGPFDTTGQHTTVTPYIFQGSGEGRGELVIDFYDQDSFFDVTFAVSSDTEIYVGGDGYATGGDSGRSTVSFRLYSGSDISAQNQIYGDFLTVIGGSNQDAFFDYTGSLSPGTYRLVIGTDITPGGFDTYALYNLFVLFESDDDNDGIFDKSDNCTAHANEEQIDADGDGFGNACDADLNNDCMINVVDLGLLRAAFLSSDAVADFNSDGLVNVTDLGIMRSQFFGMPGPSGLSQTCTPGR